MITILKAPARVFAWIKLRGQATVTDVYVGMHISKNVAQAHIRSLVRSRLLEQVAEHSGSAAALYAVATPVPEYVVKGRQRPLKNPRKAALQAARRARVAEAEVHEDEDRQPFKHYWLGADQWRLDRLPAGPPSVFHVATHGLRCEMTRRT